jgi:hypothetical protein
MVTISYGKNALALSYTNAMIINQKESDLVMIIMIIMIKRERSKGIKWW